MDTNFDTSVMIAYPYVFPQNSDLPIDQDIDAHSTIMWLGDNYEALGVSKEDIIAALSTIEFEDVGIVDVDELALFGEDKEVLVMLLNSSNLVTNFHRVENVLARIGIQNASEFDYNPHISLNYNYSGPTVGFDLPTTVGLGQPKLWWGTEVLDIG